MNTVLWFWNNRKWFLARYGQWSCQAVFYVANTKRTKQADKQWTQLKAFLQVLDATRSPSPIKQCVTLGVSDCSIFQFEKYVTRLIRDNIIGIVNCHWFLHSAKIPSLWLRKRVTISQRQRSTPDFQMAEQGSQSHAQENSGHACGKNK